MSTRTHASRASPSPARAAATPAPAAREGAPAKGFSLEGLSRAPRADAAAGARLPDVPEASQGSGKPLPRALRAKMEAAFEAPLDDVRVHEGAEAKRLGAIAYTRGANIHFQPGRYDPSSPQGQALLGHELAHVVQQRAGRVKATQRKGEAPVNADTILEREADQAGARAARGERASLPTAATGRAAPGAAAVQRRADVLQRAVDPDELERMGPSVAERKARLAQSVARSQELPPRVIDKPDSPSVASLRAKYEGGGASWQDGARPAGPTQAPMMGAHRAPGAPAAAGVVPQGSPGEATTGEQREPSLLQRMWRSLKGAGARAGRKVRGGMADARANPFQTGDLLAERFADVNDPASHNWTGASSSGPPGGADIASAVGSLYSGSRAVYGAGKELAAAYESGDKRRGGKALAKGLVGAGSLAGIAPVLSAVPGAGLIASTTEMVGKGALAAEAHQRQRQMGKTVRAAVADGGESTLGNVMDAYRYKTNNASEVHEQHDRLGMLRATQEVAVKQRDRQGMEAGFAAVETAGHAATLSAAGAAAGAATVGVAKVARVGAKARRWLRQKFLDRESNKNSTGKGFLGIGKGKSTAAKDHDRIILATRILGVQGGKRQEEGVQSLRGLGANEEDIEAYLNKSLTPDRIFALAKDR